MKSLLMLGGAWAQVPAIKRAKEMGYHVITCDYLPQNPGHEYADEYKNISTVQKEEILKFAGDKKVDGIIAYASDPSAATSAYVCDKLNIPGASYESVRRMSEKDLFRMFQKDHNFATPWFFSISDLGQVEKCKSQITYPCVVKPVDASGSKGVCVVRTQAQLEKAAADAMKFSRCGRIIIEQYINTPYCQLHGDGVVFGGRVVFLVLGDQRFRNSVPIGTSFPSVVREDILKKAYLEVERLIQEIGFSCGGINVEVRVTEEDDIYIVEIGPRSGGNYMPQIMQLATGEDLVTQVLNIAMENKCEIRCPTDIRPCFQYIIGSDESGTFEELYFDDYIKEKMADLFIHKKPGDLVEEYSNSNGVVGVALLRFNSTEEMEEDIKNIKQHIRVITRR